VNPAALVKGSVRQLTIFISSNGHKAFSVSFFLIATTARVRPDSTGATAWLTRVPFVVCRTAPFTADIWLWAA
jgi:hypothetical protein